MEPLDYETGARRQPESAGRIVVFLLAGMLVTGVLYLAFLYLLYFVASGA